MRVRPLGTTAAFGAGAPASSRTEGIPASDLRRGGVLYGIIPGLFGERPFVAVTKQLDRLKALGIDAVWLSPIQKTNDTGAISYAITDFFGVRKDYGTKRELARLVKEAHARGIKVLLDFVPNHTSNEHPMFLDAEKRGKASPFYDYYDRDAQGRPTHYFDWKHLPNLNYDNPGVRAMMIEALSYWVRELDVDGFRLDALWGVARRYPSFLSDIKTTLTAIKPDVFLLAEGAAADERYGAAGFDAGYDWRGIGKWSWEGLFEDPSTIGARLRKAIGKTPVRSLHFIDNNDTGKRFIDRHGEAMTRLASTLVMTLPGVPLLYNGEEIGASYEPYNDPPNFDFTKSSPLTAHYSRLTWLRENVPALRDGDFREIVVRGAPSVYAFRRKATDGSSVLVVLNFGEATLARLAIGTNRHDLLSGQTFEAASRIALPAKGALVLAS